MAGRKYELVRRGRSFAGHVPYLRRGRDTVASAIRLHQGSRFAAHVGPPPPQSALAPPTSLERYFDTHTVGPGLWKWRHYFPIYERHLQRFVGREVHLVEIGVFSGGSLAMWAAYFGAKTHLYGVDLEPACKVYEGNGTRIFIGDQADPMFWRRFLREVPAFDIVIDDGGHEARQLIPTFEALLPALRPGGVYLCEDVQGSTHAFHDYVSGLGRQLHTVGSGDADSGIIPTNFQRMIDSIHVYPFVSVIEKRAHRLEELIAPKHGTDWQPFYGHRGEMFPRVPNTQTNVGD